MDMLTTLSEARESLDINIQDAIKTNSRDPVRCPCCQHNHRVYHRTIYNTMVKVLVKVYKSYGTDFGKVVTRTGDFMKLRYWGFIEKSEEDPGTKKKSSGIWRVTELGELFIKGKISVKRVAHVYNNDCLGFSGADIRIRDCWPEEFDYQELMNAEAKI